MDNSKQANREEIEEIKKLNPSGLLDLIDEKRPGLLKDDKCKNFEAAFINGDIFVDHAGDVEFFENKCKLPIGISESLAKLAMEITGRETAGIKSKLLSSCHTHHVDRKLTTSQETDSRPEMQRCPTSSLKAFR